MGECSVLYVFGFRREESPARSKKIELKPNLQLTTKRRKVDDWLPILDCKVTKVWETINSNNLPYHYAYNLGMPRLSCIFCIFSPFDSLVVSGIANPIMLDRYVDVEDRIDHTFRNNFSIKSVKTAIENGHRPKVIDDWKM